MVVTTGLTTHPVSAWAEAESLGPKDGTCPLLEDRMGGLRFFCFCLCLFLPKSLFSVYLCVLCVSVFVLYMRPFHQKGQFPSLKLASGLSIF